MSRCAVVGHGPAAEAAVPLAATLLGAVPVRLELWDGTSVGPDDESCTIRLRSPDALRRVLWSPGELGIARAFVAGDVDVDGDLYEAIRALRPAAANLRSGWRALPRTAAAARRLGAVGRPPAPPPEEARPRGRRHSTARDAEVVGHHYDVGNDFYRLVLGPSMTYSCARFADPAMSLNDAQASKHDLVCRKLGLHERPGMRLLDVGCGWGSMAIHAARHYSADVVGVTISREQHDAARRRVEEADLADRVEIRLQDYRDLRGERFDAISSIGMSEHVGKPRIAEYFSTLSALLAPSGRLLNHAISSVGGSKIGSRTFMGRYVFPDGELLDVGDTVNAMQAAGCEVRDVESLREHYALTLRQWVANLEEHWDEAVDLVGPRRARVWRLYMAASAVGFDDGGLNVHQVLGVVADADGASGMPRTRDGWATA
nr:cyclopropane-fatty-acyl-phospholipid synthase family protein [Iamia sp. SCSIO 61187]